MRVQFKMNHGLRNPLGGARDVVILTAHSRPGALRTMKQPAYTERICSVYARTITSGKSQSYIMRVKVLPRNPADYLRGTKKDIPIHKGAFVAIS